MPLLYACNRCQDLLKIPSGCSVLSIIPKGTLCGHCSDAPATGEYQVNAIPPPLAPPPPEFMSEVERNEHLRKTTSSGVIVAAGMSGARYEPLPGGQGYTTMDVLPFLKGLPFDDFALGWLHTLRPSTVRVTYDSCVHTDAYTWRVTVYCHSITRLIYRISQEVEIAGGTGAEMGHLLRHRQEGHPLSPRRPRMDGIGTCFGNVAALSKVDFG